MQKLARQDCSLTYELIDLAAPWVPSPQTVVLHHGIGASRGIWAEWLPALVDRYRILRFDMRGHGASTWPEGGARPSLDTLADDLLAVMDEAGVARAHLVGESIGGTIVLNAALRAPERVASVTVSNGAHVGARLQSLHDWQEVIETRGMAGWSADMMARRFFDGTVPDVLWRWFEAGQRATNPQAVLQLVQALVGADLSDRLPALGQPVLLIHPDSSPFIPVPVVADLKARLPDARLHVIGGARHGMPVSHARTCAGLLRSFLDDQAAARERDV